MLSEGTCKFLSWVVKDALGANDEAGPAICLPAVDTVEAHAQYFHAAVFQRLFRCAGAVRGDFLLSTRSMAFGQFSLCDRAERQDEFAAAVAGDGGIDDSEVGE